MSDEAKPVPPSGLEDPQATEIRVGEGNQSAPERSGLPLSEVQREIEHAFERLLKGNWLRPSWWDFPALKETFEAKTPKVNVIDREHDMLVQAELPGVQREDLEVTVRGDSLVIRASAGQTRDETDGTYHRREIAWGQLSRTVALPDVPDLEQVDARLADGLLTVVIGKLTGAPGRSIEVR